MGASQINYIKNWDVRGIFETCRNTDFEEARTEPEVEPKVELEFEL